MYAVCAVGTVPEIVIYLIFISVSSVVIIARSVATFIQEHGVLLVAATLIVVPIEIVVQLTLNTDTREEAPPAEFTCTKNFVVDIAQIDVYMHT